MALRPWQAQADALTALPHALCARVNPADPDHARRILTEWADSQRRVLHDKFLTAGEWPAEIEAPSDDDGIGEEA